MDREAPMTYPLRANHTSHCELCSPGVRNYVRTHIGDPNDCGPRLAICAVHDIAGPVEALPSVLRALVTP
jgi:hypothetical protein